MTPGKKDDERGAWARALRESAPYLGIGSGMAFMVLLSLGAGYWVDKKLGTSPIFVLLGAAFGLLAAAYQIFKVYKLMTGRKP